MKAKLRVSTMPPLAMTCSQLKAISGDRGKLLPDTGVCSSETLAPIFRMKL